MDILLNDFDDKIREVKMPIVVIYKNTKKYPGKYAARLFDIDKPTDYIVVKDTLEKIRKIIPKFMVKFNRAKNDNIAIVESYL